MPTIFLWLGAGSFREAAAVKGGGGGD